MSSLKLYFAKESFTSIYTLNFFFFFAKIQSLLKWYIAPARPVTLVSLTCLDQGVPAGIAGLVIPEPGALAPGLGSRILKSVWYMQINTQPGLDLDSTPWEMLYTAVWESSQNYSLGLDPGINDCLWD